MNNQNQNQNQNQDKGDPPGSLEPKGWLTGVLRGYFAPEPGAEESASMEFASRCHEAAMRGLEIARMHRERWKIEGTMGSLRDHLAALARLAGVRLDEILIYVGVKNAEEPDASSALGLARLAQMLDMSRAEAELRMRIGFAIGALFPGTRELATEIEPALARDPSRGSVKIEPLLRSCEAGYNDERREMVTKAVAVLNSVFEAAGEP